MANFWKKTSLRIGGMRVKPVLNNEYVATSELLDYGKLCDYTNNTSNTASL